MKKQTLSTQPYKGTRDLLPQNFRVQKYIFDTWRKVCESYGYKEYQTPLLEPTELYKAKSGEDVGGKELYTLTDGAGRELALRPELTPSVTRIVTQKYKEWPKPIKLFSIGNFYRYERPQRGRTREFWQLNADIFGDASIGADIETLKLAIDLMLAFNPPETSFMVCVNSRKIIFSLCDNAEIPEADRVNVVRILDKWNKLGKKACIQKLQKLGLAKKQLDKIQKYMRAELLETEPRLEQIFTDLNNPNSVTSNGKTYGNYIKYEPSLVRGFDYYDDLVFEVFDTTPENTRSLFGGGRYNGLAELFGAETIPAVGFAPGEETIRLFLETWNLIPQVYCVANMFRGPNTKETAQKAMREIRAQGKIAIQTISRAPEKKAREEVLKDSQSAEADFTILIGDPKLVKDPTLGDNAVGIINMKTGNLKTYKTLDQLLPELVQ